MGLTKEVRTRFYSKSGKLKISKDLNFDESSNNPTVARDISDRYSTFEIPGSESEHFQKSDNLGLQKPDARTSELVASETNNIEQR